MNARVMFFFFFFYTGISPVLAFHSHAFLKYELKSVEKIVKFWKA